jgi:thioredoxin reductase (NADPH)
MPKPIILSVDDEPQVLNAVERDLRRHFGSGYRILKASSGPEALQMVRELKKRNAAVALFLVDQKMPEMSGTEFLLEALKIYPQAKKALLTAYADTQAAIRSINEIGLDYYFLKPWDPPERELYPVLEDLLSDWGASFRPPFEGLRVVGTLWSAHSHTVKDFLARNQIPYRWLDFEKDPEAHTLLRALDGEPRLPLVVFPDGSQLIDPDPRELARRIGLQTQAARPFYDLIIIGGGPAGLAAAVYGGSEGLRTVLIEREATGGQAGTSAMIENYLGFPRGLSGADLARRATSQARRFGVEIIAEEVLKVRADGPYRYVTLSDGSELSGHTLLIATGVSVRRLEAPGVEKLTGAGVYYGAAWTEAAYYRDCEVMVVGGANSAGQGAMFLAHHARKVYLVVRGASLESGMSRYLVDQIRATANIQVLLGVEVMEAKGDGKLQSVLLSIPAGALAGAPADAVRGANLVPEGITQAQLRQGVSTPGDSSPGASIPGASTPPEPRGGSPGQGWEVREIPLAALFIFIGATARTDMLDGVVERDPAGFILTGQDLPRGAGQRHGWIPDRDPYLLETSMPGIFAAGDVRHESIKRVASAVGEGAVAVAFIHQYLKTV